MKILTENSPKSIPKTLLTNNSGRRNSNHFQTLEIKIKISNDSILNKSQKKLTVPVEPNLSTSKRTSDVFSVDRRDSLGTALDKAKGIDNNKSKFI